MSDQVRVGMIGFSEGNGHPFSFSAIVNGYSEDGMAASGWPGIHAYLRRRDASEFGGLGLMVTHAWSQEPVQTERLCSACLIPHVVTGDRPEVLIGEVDAVVIARDDHRSHLALAWPFLEAGMPVLLDKPLTLSLTDLREFIPYLESGQLMSASGMRYARELDETRAQIGDHGELRLVRGVVLNDWARYGIHLIDATLNLITARPVAVTPLPSRHQSVAIELDDGCVWQLDALGAAPPCFRIGIYGTDRISEHVITDNFSMFRRLLFHFSVGVRSGRPSIPPADTIVAIRLLIAGDVALREKRTVRLDELEV